MQQNSRYQASGGAFQYNASYLHENPDLGSTRNPGPQDTNQREKVSVNLEDAFLEE